MSKHSGFTALDDIINANGHTLIDRRQLRKPTLAKRETFGRFEAGQANLAALTSGTLFLFPIDIVKGESYTGLSVFSGSTVMVTPTHQWFSLWRADTLAQIGLTSDDTNTAWAALTLKPLAFTGGPILGPYTGLALGGVVITAATVPSLWGLSFGTSALTSLAPRYLGNSTTTLTDPSTAPNPAGAITQAASLPYAYLY